MSVSMGKKEINKYNMEGATDKVCRLLFLSKYL